MNLTRGIWSRAFNVSSYMLYVLDETNENQRYMLLQKKHVAFVICLCGIYQYIFVHVSFLHLTFFSFLSLFPSIKNPWWYGNDNIYITFTFYLPLHLFVRHVCSFSIFLCSLLVYYVFIFVMAATVVRRKLWLVFQTWRTT